jgi:cytochrome c-type biogenesis protein CcmH/NrfG
MEKAIKAVNKALEINPKFEEAWGLLGRIYAHTRERQKALEAYDTALEIDSGLEQ